MSNEVDNRIVSMTFDNAAFGNKMAETIRGLDKLQQSLKMTEGGHAMADVQKSFNRFDTSAVTTGIEGVSAKFLAMSTIAITAIAGITTKVASMGAQMAKGFTVGPITDGFREYETNMNSIQTILANTNSKGTTLDDVNNALDELNHYSDQTIYNFSEMAKNIGTFTAAGVDLDTSTSAIKGIANLAALSGSSADQASSAMYQLSQALAAGTVKAQDWISVTNAGMGGEIFQKALFETGKSLKTIKGANMGTEFETWAKKAGGFKQTLQDGWLTSKVLTNTLQAFTGDMTKEQLKAMGYTEEQGIEMQRLGKIGKAAATEVKTLTQLMGTIKEAVGSGWSSSFKTIFGDFEAAKSLFTAVNTSIGNMVGKSSDARNDMLRGWAAFGGRNDLIAGLVNSFKGLVSMFNPIKLAFRTLFPKKTIEDLVRMTQAFAKFGKNLKIGGDTAEKIFRIFRGLFSVLKFGIAVVKGIWSVFAAFFGAIGGAGDSGGILSVLATIGDLLSGLGATVDSGGVEAFFDGLATAVGNIAGVIASAGTAISDFFGNLFGGDKKGKDPKKDLDETGKKITWFSDLIKGIGDTLKSVGQGISNFFAGVASIIKGIIPVVQKIGKSLGLGDMDRAMQLLKGGSIAAITLGLYKMFKSITKTFQSIQKSIDQIGESVAGMFGELGDTLKAFQLKLKAQALKEIAIAIAILAASMFLLSLIDSNKLMGALAAMAGGFGALIGVMKLMQKLDLTTAAKDIAILSAAMILMAVAALILAFAVTKLADMGWADMIQGIAGVAAMLGAMALASKALGDGTKGMFKTAFSLIGLGIALLIMSFGLKSLNKLNFIDLAKGLIGVGAAMLILTKTLGSIKDDEVARKGLGMLLLAVSLRAVAKAIAMFAAIPMYDLVKGSLAIALILEDLAAAMNQMPPNLPAIAFGIGLLTIALFGLSKVVEIFGGMDMLTLAKGIGAMALVLLILGAAMLAMNAAQPGAAAILTAAAAMVVLAGAMKILGSMGIGQIAASLVAFALVLAVIAAAAILLTPIVPLIAALGLAVGVLGIGLLAFGAGAYLAAAAVVLLASAGKKGIDTLIDIFNALIAALPGFMSVLTQALIQMAQDFLDSFPDLIDTMGMILGMLIDKVIEITPKLFEAFGLMIDGLTLMMIEKGPAFIEAGFQLLGEFLLGLQQQLPLINETAVMMLTSFIQAITNQAGIIAGAAANLLSAFILGVMAQVPRIIMTGVGILLQLLNGIAMAIPMLVQAVTNVIVAFINSLTANLPRIIEAGTNLLIAFIAGIGASLDDVIAQGVAVVLKFLEGLANSALDLANGAAEVLIDFLEGLEAAIRDKSKRINEAGVGVADAIIDGVVEGISGGLSSVTGAISDMAGSAIDKAKSVFGINSPSKVFRAIGSGLIEGLVKGVDKDADSAANSVGTMAQKVTNSFLSSVKDLPSMLAGIDDIEPVIAPVLDLTQLRAEAKSMSGILGNAAIAPTVSVETANLISTAEQQRGESADVVIPDGGGDVTYVQNNYSPKALSTADIYRNTKGQINSAKEELKIA